MMNADEEICVICKKKIVENDDVVEIRKKKEPTVSTVQVN